MSSSVLPTLPLGFARERLSAPASAPVVAEPAERAAPTRRALRSAPLDLHGKLASPTEIPEELVAQAVESIGEFFLDPTDGSVIFISSDGEIKYTPGKRRRWDKPAKARLSRWSLLSAVQEILKGTGAGTCKCHRVRRSVGDVEVLRTDEGARYGNLVTCKSVWACPVCSARITERRRVELREIIARWEAEGGEVWLVTFTVPHSGEDDLADLVARFRGGNGHKGAVRRFKGGQAWVGWQAELGIEGTVTALEVTWGEVNGWHPHQHELWLVRPGVSGGAFARAKDAMFARWCAAVEREGFRPPAPDVGFNVQRGESAGEVLAGYVSKWGFPEELSKGHVKTGRAGRFTPWDLVRAWAGDRDEGAAARFVEFTRVFKGRQLLNFSRGLRARFGLQDRLSDGELADRDDAQVREVYRVTLGEWRLVLRRRDGRGLLLYLFDVGGADAVSEYLAGLKAAVT